MLKNTNEIARVATLLALRAYPYDDGLRETMDIIKSRKKLKIDSWAGDAFAYAVGELRFTEEEIEKARKELFID